jgi:hypothetical protein
MVTAWFGIGFPVAVSVIIPLMDTRFCDIAGNASIRKKIGRSNFFMANVI